MSKKSYPLFEPLPYYMSAMGMAGARFIEGAPEPVATPDPVTLPAATPDPKDEALGEGGIKALQSERDARAKAEKDLADARTQLQQIEDAKLSDIQKAQKEAADAAARVTALESANARLSALAKYPVAEEYQDLVTGTDAASYEASAKRVSELVAKTQTPGTPKPDPSGGARSEKTGTLAEQIAAAEKAGDKSATASLKAQQLGALASNRT